MKTWEEATKLNRTDILMLVFYIMNGILDITVSIISENKTWIICGLLWITIALMRYCDLKIIKGAISREKLQATNYTCRIGGK